jgi:NADPH2:quinone reductase
MKAIKVHEFGAPTVMKLEELPDLAPAEDQLLVKIHAIGVNPVDTYIRSGLYARSPKLPYTPGSDAAGDIIARGDKVKGFSPGDRVYLSATLSGAYADQALCLPTHAHHLPAATTYAQGAAMGVPYATAYRAIFHRAQARAGETVLVHGATGGVGLAAVQILRAYGFKIIGTGGTEQGRQVLRQQGAHYVLDHHAGDFAEQVLSITEGKGVNLILEMLANINLGKDLDLLAHSGRVVVIGSRGKVEIDPRATMGRDAAIFGMSLFNASEADLASIHAALTAGLENGALRPIIKKEFPLADAALAHQAVMEAGALGKIILIP